MRIPRDTRTTYSGDLRQLILNLSAEEVEIEIILAVVDCFGFASSSSGNDWEKLTRILSKRCMSTDHNGNRSAHIS